MPHQQPRIQFADHDTIHEVTHLNDMEDEEVASAFYTKEELRAIKKESKTLVRMMEEGLHISNGKELFDTRGLEAHTKEYKRWSRELRYTLYDSIHAAQSSQHDCWGGEQDDSSDLIAPLSRQISAISTELALATAKEDSCAARPNRNMNYCSSTMSKNESIHKYHEGLTGFVVTPPTIRRKLFTPGAA
jgi:hypothetical protein